MTAAGPGVVSHDIVKSGQKAAERSDPERWW